MLPTNAPQPTQSMTLGGGPTMGTAPGAPQKISHAECQYGPAHGQDRCDACKHYLGPNNCEIVVPPILPDGWCNRFLARQSQAAPGSSPPFAGAASMTASPVAPPAPPSPGPGADTPMAGDAKSGALALGGVHHMHKAGIITPEEKADLERRARHHIAKTAANHGRGPAHKPKPKTSGTRSPAQFGSLAPDTDKDGY